MSETNGHQVSAPTGPVAPEGVNHLVLNVREMQRSHDFWSGIMGFRQVGELQRKGPDGGPGTWMRFYQGSTGSHHDLALSQVMVPAETPDHDGSFSMAAQRTGINHVAIKWSDRDAWLKQLAWMQSQGVVFHRRVEHGMTHSAYITDPDGHGIEVLYELPREIWEGDINAALNYAVATPNQGAEALEDNTDYVVFGEKRG